MSTVRAFKSERHIALAQEWPACSRCDGDGGTCACPQACLIKEQPMRRDRFDNQARIQLRWLAVAIVLYFGLMVWALLA